MNAFENAKPFEDASIVLTEDVKDGHFFYIVADEENNAVNYQTRWSPNCDDVKDIAVHFGVEIEHHWEEGGCNCYGRAMYYPDGSTIRYDLPEEFLDQITEDDDGMYHFNGEEYECHEEIIEDEIDKEWDKLIESKQ